MRAVGRDLIRGGHYGQRSCEPHQKAEHMAAPTNAAKREESSCQHGAVHAWQLLLQKSFWVTELKYGDPHVRLHEKNVGASASCDELTCDSRGGPGRAASDCCLFRLSAG